MNELKLQSKFDSDEYKKFLYDLHEITSIDSIILDNLIKLKLIQEILVYPDAITIADYCFHISKSYLKLKENYTQIPEFIFASYSLHNPLFNVKPFSLDEKYIDLYYLTDSNINNPTFLTFTKGSFSPHFYIHHFLNIDLNYFSNQINLLLEEEKEDLQFLITKKLRYNGRIEKLFLNGKEYLFLKNPSKGVLEDELTHIYIDKLIYKKREELLIHYENIKQIEQITINNLFEKVRLRQEMNTF